MSMSRLALAEQAALLPDLGACIAVLGPCDPSHVGGLTADALCGVQHSFQLTQSWQQAGLPVGRVFPEGATGAIVIVPRAKKDARNLIALAVSQLPAGAWIVVDGQKTDGVESLLKDVGKLIGKPGAYSKAHGKTFWFANTDTAPLNDWAQASDVIAGGWRTAPGVFSADGVDPASALLIDSLPEIAGTVADLGAGWGYLSAKALAKSPAIEAMHLVEDNAAALDCARHNVSDPRAKFHWLDALSWQPPALMDWVIMNPPFHSGRAATPDLGQAFIHKARDILKPGGTLVMVGNAHLPYDVTLNEAFHAPQIIARTTRFKVYQAEARRRVSRNR
ncbi:MAG: class I SAM-dependent methyltransferase [Pseudomonadota bacterium]